MSFTRRYLLWLLIPPALVTVGPALAFLSQVVQLTWSTSFALLGMLALFYAGGTIIFWSVIGPRARAVEEALEGRGDLSQAMSRCLETTTRLSILLWGIGGLVFAVVGTLIAMPTKLGLGYFIVAALIAAFPSVAWGYGAGKHQLMKVAEQANARTHYTGRELTLGKKIAVIFIGSFIVSAAALVQLISSKVSTTLEALAITSSAERFDRVFESANLMANVDEAALDTLKLYVPNEYSLHVIDKQKHLVSTKDPLSADEVTAISRLRTGDSSAFVSPHVIKFRELKNGSIIALAIPWAPYQGIPFQITFYTIIIALFTTAAFSIATFFLARDVTTPVRELRALAAEMAQGNFDVAARVFSDDEVGQLADSLGETRESLRRLLGRVGGSGTTITEGVRVITGGTESLITRSRNQTDLAESSSFALENVRGGIRSVLAAADTVTDLTQDASSRSLELQASAEEVARSMDYLFQSVEKTSSSTTEMNASMNEMSGRTQVLAGIGEEVLSFVSEMDSTVAELRSTAQATAEIAEQVRVDAEAGGAAVNRTVEGINASRDVTTSAAQTLDELQRSIGEISRILSVIEEITNRTNLLALNAAIIAAQAGEHGAGFTVVAGEIRELAERTRGSTKEISDIIKAIQTNSRSAVTKMHQGVEQVKGNVALAQDASQSLTKIVGSATRSFEMATKISRALDEQAQASRRLHDVSARMSDHIAELNRGTTEQARGTQLLAQEAERVRDIAAQVKNATEEQSTAGKGITRALEKIAEDARAMRDLLVRQLEETDAIADASRTMLEIAQENDAIAREFNNTVQYLVRSGQEFESEVSRFRVSVQS